MMRGLLYHLAIELKEVVLHTTSYTPRWRNWSTRLFKGQVSERTWGFESPSGYKIYVHKTGFTGR
jgi:hypothetical protein